MWEFDWYRLFFSIGLNVTLTVLREALLSLLSVMEFSEIWVWQPYVVLRLILALRFPFMLSLLGHTKMVGTSSRWSVILN
jgi:hypothetical protein